jgi:hypothetical protein
MPFHVLPAAIVIAKIGASAVVSLAPVAMSREETEDGQVNPTEPSRFRDFFKKEFYEKEFARLQNEQLLDAEQTSIPSSSRKDLVLRTRPALQEAQHLDGDPIVMPRSRGFFHRKFTSLQQERVE